MNAPVRRGKRQITVPATKAVGQVGASQVVSSFGVGSIYEVRSAAGNGTLIVHSVMLSGLEFWPLDPAGHLYEPSLQRSLGVRYFRRPPGDASKQKTLPASRFPGVHYCSAISCGRVGKIGQEFLDRGFSGVICGNPSCKGRGIPFRFITACHREGDSSQPGHVDEFPYVWWAHSRSEADCSSASIVLKSVPERTGLEGMYLYCNKCKSGRSLAGIFSEEALTPVRCRGRRPWLGDSQEGCERAVRVLQRGASNVYFPVRVSAISIPPHSSRLQQLLRDAIPPHFLKNLQEGGEAAIQSFTEVVRNMPGLDDPERYSDGQLRAGLSTLAGLGNEVRAVENSAEQKRLEQNAIFAGSDDDEGEFEAEPINLVGTWVEDVLDRLVQIHRLREVCALRGFQRVEPAYGVDPYRVENAPLSKTAQEWLPAIEVRGEGIYLGLNYDRVARWEASPSVQQRLLVLNGNYRQACASAGREPDQEYSARFVLAHTLSHLMMKQLSLECGYSGSSLRERLYVDEEDPTRTGFMIYTASSSADGTLGGLVSQGTAEVLPGMLESAVQSARWCSSDPLCEESMGQGHAAMNLAACHACSLVAETSCEERNMLLDRALVVGTTSNPSIGYFHSVISNWDQS